MASGKAMEEYRTVMRCLIEADEKVDLLEEQCRRIGEKVFEELFDVKRGDILSYMGRTDILVVGFDWKPSLAELDYDTPRPPTLIVSTRRLDGEWGKTLTKHVMGLKKMEKKGTDMAAVDRLRLRA